MNNEIITLRKELHQYPEVSGHELNTSKIIKAFIQKHHNTTILEGIGGHGLAAIYTFSAGGPTIVIRCELDALPIQETNQFGHRSKCADISHKCGHDGHMAIVAGLIFFIKKQTFQAGKIVLLFQPAEETGKGAQRIIEDKRFTDLNPDYIFALHNIPGIPLHKIIIIKNFFSAEVQSLAVFLDGIEAHAAEPDKGINPALAIADIVSQLSFENNLDASDEHFSVLTPIHISMGQKSYGISAGNGQIHYTIRTRSEAQMKSLIGLIEKTIHSVTNRHQLTYRITWFEHFPASINHEDANQNLLNAAHALDLEIEERMEPFKFGEDFGWFSKKYKSTMFGLGAGINTPPLHHPAYDFPDKIISTGIDIFSTLINQLLIN